MSNADLSDSHPKKVQPHQKQTGKQNLSIYPNSNFIIFVLNIKKRGGRRIN